MTYDLKDHLRSLVESHGPSGHEAPVREILKNAWTPFVDTFEQDGLGSLIGIKRATQPTDPPRRIMLAAHMDEIGMMVREIVDGFIMVHRISGVDNRVMLAQPVMVHGSESLPGVVAAAPPHLSDPADRKRYPGFDELIIDIGLPAHEVEAKVRPGDLITVDVSMVELLGQKVAGKAMDDRACVAAVTHCLSVLNGLQHSWDVYAVATVQEETGLLGAQTAAHRIHPDVAIALDVTFAPQSGVSSDDTSNMSDGPAISFGPNFHTKLYHAIRDRAKALEMKIQDDVIAGGSGTDAWTIQISRQGIPTALLNIPIRNMHSPVETADLRDIERSGRLLAHFIAWLDGNFLANIDWQYSKTQVG